jgi:hypothetical protein
MTVPRLSGCAYIAPSHPSGRPPNSAFLGEPTEIQRQLLGWLGAAA